MALRALLLACACARTAEAWAPPRRLAPLRIGTAWATPRGRRASPRVRLLATTEETEVPRNVPEDAPLELTNKILRSMRSFPALVGAGALSWLAPPTLVGTAFFLGTGTDLSREVLNSIEDVVLASLSIVLGTLVSTAVSVLRDRQEKIRCCMLREASLLDTLAQQLVKLFRYDKARLKRVTTVLERYVEEKRKSIRKSTVYGYRDYYAHWDGSLSCVSGAFLVMASTASLRPRHDVRRRRAPPFPPHRSAKKVARDPGRRRGVPGQPDRRPEVRLFSLVVDGRHLPVRSFSF